MTRTEEFLGTPVSREERIAKIQRDLESAGITARMFGLEDEFQGMLQQTLDGFNEQEVKEQ